jgi:hypothetical protein
VAAYCSNGEGWPCPAASFLKFLAPATSFLKFPVSASCSIVLGAGGLHHQWTGGNIDFQSCSGNDQDGVDLGFLSTMTYSSSDNPSATLERILYIFNSFCKTIRPFQIFANLATNRCAPP